MLKPTGNTIICGMNPCDTILAMRFSKKTLDETGYIHRWPVCARARNLESHTAVLDTMSDNHGD